MADDREPDAAEPAALPIRLLVVDNDEALARAMEESLAKVGYECVVATSGPPISEPRPAFMSITPCP